jgi:hypothetical protein
LIVLFTLTVALFLYGGLRLFELRFETGDVYAEYSSLRTDPLGTRVFYESLEHVGSAQVARNTMALSHLPSHDKGTLILAGLRRHYGLLTLSDSLPPIEQLLGSGWRVVICFYPEVGEDPVWPMRSEQSQDSKSNGPPREESQHRKDDSKPGSTPEQTENLWLRRANLARRWGIEFDLQKAPSAGNKGQHSTAALATSVDLPNGVSWHSLLAFKNLNPAWKVIYRRQDRPVVIERAMGSGSLVLASDSYFLSNEALWKERQAKLLAWLVGNQRRIVFDETHLGIEETPGVVSLMRRYRLHGLLAGLLLLAGLFIWKNMMSLVPSHTLPDAEDSTSGFDSAAGFVKLLRRSVSTPELLLVCVQHWTKSLPANSRECSRIPHVQALLTQEAARPSKMRDPVKVYRAICHEVQRRQL